MDDKFKIMDEFHDELVRSLTPGQVYATNDGGVFFVMRVDNGSVQNEFVSGRRPAATKVIFLISAWKNTWKEGTQAWLIGRDLEWMAPRAVT